MTISIPNRPLRTGAVLIGALLAAAPLAAAARLLPPGAADVAPARLQALPAPTGDVERAPVRFAWALDPSAPLEATTPHVAESREYWRLVDAAELERGIDLQTTAPGAVVRLSPADGKAIDPAAIRLSTRTATTAGARETPIAAPLAFEQRHDAAAMRAAGLDVPDGSAVVRIAKSHGAGTFRLQAPASGRTLVHVYEPDSPYVLKAQAIRDDVLAGERLEVAAVLQRGVTKLGGGALSGDLVSPSGARWPLTFRDGRASIVVPADAGDTPGLWEVALYAGHVDGGVLVQREARTAVQVTRPTARLTGAATFDAGARTLALPVEVAGPGRYELRGTLYATGSDGVARPVAQAHAAAWLEPGTRTLALAFAGVALPAGHGAPFEVRDLELRDQARHGRLETRAVAVRGGDAAAGPDAAPRAPLRDRLVRR